MCNFKGLKENQKLSEVQFYTVKKIKGNQVQLENDLGENIVVDNKYVETCLTSAHEVVKEEKMSRTELAQLFLNSQNVAFTVCFNKQVKQEDVMKEIMEAYGNSTPKEFDTKLKKAVKTALNGEERILTGKHSGSVDEFGRIHVTDLEIAKDAAKTYDVRQRLVDPRTIQWVIVRGVKYIAK